MRSGPLFHLSITIVIISAIYSPPLPHHPHEHDKLCALREPVSNQQMFSQLLWLVMQIQIQIQIQIAKVSF